MSAPQVSLHGKRLTITSAGHLTGDGFMGDLIGHPERMGSDILASYSPINDCVFFDDFVGATIDQAWTHPTKGSDGGTVDFAINAQLGGAIRGTTGAGAGATMAVNGVQIDSALNWQANKGALTLEMSVKPSAITTICMFFGFTNQVAALKMPFTNSADTISADAANSDAVGFSFDTSATTQHTFLAGVNNAGTPQQQTLGVAPDTAAYHRYRLEINTSGDTDFYIDGAVVGSRMLAALRPNQPLSPVVAVFTRAAGSANMDCDWVYVRQQR